MPPGARRSLRAPSVVVVVLLALLGAGALTACDDADGGSRGGSRPSASSERTLPPDPTPAAELAFWSGIDPCAIARLTPEAGGAADAPSSLSQIRTTACQARLADGFVEVDLLAPISASDLDRGQRTDLSGRAGYLYPGIADGTCRAVAPTSSTRSVQVQAPGRDCRYAAGVVEAAVEQLTTDPTSLSRPAGARAGACGLLAAVATPDYGRSDGTTCASAEGTELWLSATLAGLGRESTAAIAGTDVVIHRLGAGDRPFAAGRRTCAVDWALGPYQSVATRRAVERAAVFGADCAQARRAAARLIPAARRAAPRAAPPTPVFYPADAPLPAGQ